MALAGGEVAGSHQPHGHRLAMAQLEIRQPLKGVGKGMTQVEHRAPAPLVGVGLDHVYLDRHRLADNPG